MKNKKINLSSAIFAVGIFLMIFLLTSELIFFRAVKLETNLFPKLFSAFLIYSAAVLYFGANEKNCFKKSLLYLKNSLNYFYAVIAIFIISALAGFLLHEKLQFLDDILKEIVARTLNLNTKELIVFILLNNSLASLLGLFGGIFFSIYPLINSLGNGIVIGYVASKVPLTEFWRILPHGIFELPAIFISFGLGIKLGFFIFAKNKKTELKKRIYNSLLVAAFIIIPLLIIAALIEGILITILP